MCVDLSCPIDFSSLDVGDFRECENDNISDEQVSIAISFLIEIVA